MSLRTLVLVLASLALTAAAAAEPPRVRLQTTLGDIVIELDSQRAPQSVANFLSYVDAGHYDGTLFHRVIPGFMIQGGGFDREFARRQTNAPIRNEADNGLKNERGTIAMARTSDPHSASAQFFINTVRNEFLDHRAPTAQGWGYAVFGRVVEGMDTVDRISAAPTGARGPFRDVPRTAVVIETAVRIDGD